MALGQSVVHNAPPANPAQGDVAMDTFWSYRGWRWLWVNALLVAAAIVWYAWHEPLGAPNGGTVYGYTIGGIAAAGIFYLMWYGIRKRSYHAHRTTLKGTLAAHVWLGVALSVLVPLHAGFQFGWNVHTLAYVLMMIVVISGIWGAIYYSALAPQIQSHRGGGTIKELVQQLHILEQNQSVQVAQKSDQLLQCKAYVDTHLGGAEFAPRFWRVIFMSPVAPFDSGKIGQLLAALPEAESAEGISLVQGADRRRELVNRIVHEIKTLTKLRAWLYIHLPVSCAMLAALLIHIFVVFFYRG